MERPLRVLIPEDSEDDAALLLRELARLGYRTEHLRVDDREGMRAALTEQRWDLILCDYSMPGFSGLEALHLTQEMELDIPFIVLSGEVGEDVAVQAMKAGAHDFIVKGRLSRLGEAIEREIGQAVVRAERRQGVRQIQHLNQVLRAIRSVDRLIVQEKDPERLIQRAAELLVETRGFLSAAFLIADRGAGAALVAARNEAGRAIPMPLESTDPARAPDCLQRAMASQELLMLDCDRPSCEGCPLQPLHAGKTRLAGNLAHADRSFGAVIITLPGGDTVDDEERALFEELVGDIAFALHGIDVAAQERESQEQFRQLFETMAQGVVLQDETGQIVRCNPAAEQILGLSLAQMQGCTSMDPRWRAIREDGTEYPGEQHPAMVTLRSGRPSRDIMGVFNPEEESYRWISVNAVPRLHPSSDDPTGVFATFEDITPLREAELALREAQSIAGLGRWELDLRSNELTWSRSIFDLFEIDQAEFKASFEAFLELVHPDDRAGVDAAFSASLANRTPYGTTHRLLMADGRIKWVREQGRTEYAADGEPIRSIGTVQDISDLKLVEEELRARNEFIQTILDHLPIGLAVNDIGDGRATYLNDGFAETYGWPKEELTNVDRFFELVYPDPEVRLPLQQRVMADITSRDPDRMKWSDLEATGQDGRKRIIDAVNIPLYDQNVMISTVRDITDQVRQQEKIRELEHQYHQAQKMESVGRLAGGVAHDFNNLLTVIQSFAGFAVDDLRPGDPLRADLQQILEACSRAAALTRQLLAFSRKQVLEPRVIDLNEILDDLDKMLQRLIGEDVEFLTVKADNVGLVQADPGQIEQLLMNLAVNARDAMPTGGVLTVETANVVLDEEYASKHPDTTPGPHVMLAVSDDGEGMAGEVKERLFEPFFTTKEKGQGTGLGLATVYGIVKQSGGNIWVYSEPGQGTTFKVYLPTVDAEKSVPGERSEDLVVSGTETILVVEDEPAVRNLTCRILSRAGYKVLTAANGGEALLECERHSDEIHLVLTDVVMPKMSGRELADRLSALSPGLRVLYMSGYTDNAIVHHGVLDAGTLFISKPFNARELLAKVGAALRDVRDSAPDPDERA